MWFLDEIEIVENQCTVEIIASNKYDKQSKFSIPCIDAVHFEEALNPIVALSPGGVHTARLNDMIVSAGLWSISQGFSVFDPLHLCKFLHVSYTTEGRFENVQEIRIRPVQQQDSSWCTYEIAVLALACSNGTRVAHDDSTKSLGMAYRMASIQWSTQT